MTHTTSAWILPGPPRSAPTVRLFCFPHGGGGPQGYRTWPDGLPDAIDVCAIAPPGRGARHREAPIPHLAVAIDEIVAALRPLIDMPFALFGHSVGAMLAYEVARRLEADGLHPLHVFLSGLAEPDAAPPSPAHADASDDDLLAAISTLGLLPADALTNPELRGMLLPPLRADFRLCQDWHPALGRPLAAPMTVFGGRDDALTPAPSLTAWQAHASGPFVLHLFDGGHFFTETARNALLGLIASTLENALAALPPSIALGAAEDYPHDTCLHELFRRQAAATPSRLALQDTTRSLTFAGLDAESDLLARRLLGLGMGIDRTAAILMETSADYVVAYLAALKAGGAYLPIPLTTPDLAIAEILDAVQPCAVLTRRAYCVRLPAGWQGDDRSVCLDEGWTASLNASDLPDLAAAPKPGPDDLAYCVMTSGTTGKPKGIVCPHRGAVNSYWWRYVHLPYRDGEREACNVFFVWEVLRPLLQGLPAYVIPDDVIFDPRRLLGYLDANAVTRVLFTPSLFEQVLNAVAAAPASLPALRMVILNGEVVTSALRDRAHAMLPGVTLVNDYSISECHDVTTSTLTDATQPATGSGTPSRRYLPAGHVMANVRVYVLDEAFRPVPWGVTGEIYVAGPNLARGYLNLPEMTAERFLPDPIQGAPARMFRTGDIGRLLADGQLEVRGRSKFMVKLRGYSVVPSAVEAAIGAHPLVAAAAVVTADDPSTGQPDHLVAYVAGRDGAPDEALLGDLRSHLKQRLPAYAIPAVLVPLAAMPIAPATGKIDRKRLPAAPVAAAMRSPADMAARSMVIDRLADIWTRVLGRRPPGPDANFFDLGGHSLLAIELALQAESAFGVRLDVIDVFDTPVLGDFAARIEAAMDAGASPGSARHGAGPVTTGTSGAIAVVGMACRFPGADDPDALWSNLLAGHCAIRTFDDAELSAFGVPRPLIDNPAYVKAGAILENPGLFDPRFFGLSEREAVLMDPQHRLFIECCWHALENAGYRPRQVGLRTGVFAGCYLPTYLVHHLDAASTLDPADPAAFHLAETGNDKDYLATRTAYLLDLDGPAISVQTSCSTGLVAIAQAASALAAGQCDMALAGASSLTFPQGGYAYLDGHVGARGGVCRTFDAEASGTILGDGVGAVVLRRLEDALRDGDRVLAVLKGWAINNDGASKAGYSAPGVRGQVDVIRTALAHAGVEAGSIGYVEAHGTATVVGDPIEVRALTQAYRETTNETGYCALGSLKPNIGHANIAAGVAGFIKAVQALRHAVIPPQINLATPNPDLRLDTSPFRIPVVAEPFPRREAAPRRAGVSSFGIGGTNAHAILEEAPPSGPRKPLQPTRFDRHLCWPTPRPTERLLPWADRFRVPGLRRLPSPPSHGTRDLPLAANSRGAAPRPLLLLAAGTPPLLLADLAARLSAMISTEPAEVALSTLPADAPSHIVCLWPLGPSGDAVSAIAGLCALIAARPRIAPLALTVAAFDSAEATMLSGLLRVLGQETRFASGRLILLAPGVDPGPALAAEIAADPSAPPLVRLTPTGRFTERFDPYPLTPDHRQRGEALLTTGPHIVTGGHGRIGLALSGYLSHLGAPVVLVSRRPVSAGTVLQPNVTSISADVCDRTALDTILHETFKRHGRLGGIFHLAGLAKVEELRDVTATSLSAELAPKVAGTRAIASAIAALPPAARPSFVMAFSSLAATLGGLGLASYAAANRFLDAWVADVPIRDGVRWISAAWDDWDFDYGAAQMGAYARTRAGLSIPPADGFAALAAILGDPGLANVLVSATALDARLDRWLSAAPLTHPDPQAAPARPAPASGSLEAMVTAAYRSALGSVEISADDDFFALGGDSLHATEIVHDIQTALPSCSLRIADVFDNPSIRQLTAHLETVIAPGAPLDSPKDALQQSA